MKPVGSKASETYQNSPGEPYLVDETPETRQALDDLRPGAFVPAPDPKPLELLKWVGEHIKLVNANGKVSDKFCLICRRSQHPTKFCRHNDIWAVSATRP
jgi:hypothetical protein